MEITDLSDLCRLCLDSSPMLIPFTGVVYFSKRSIPDLLSYCLDINCRDSDSEILPKRICQSCMDKLRVVFEFKTKSKESDKYLQQILESTAAPDNTEITPYQHDEVLPFQEKAWQVLSITETTDASDEESLLEPVEEDPTVKLRKGQKSGSYVCQVCSKPFKYVKPFMNHMKTHKQTAPERSLPPNTVRAKRPAASKQPPYDSQSPYGSPAPFEDSTSHDSLDPSLLNFGSIITKADEEPTSKRPRIRKQKLPSKSPSREPSPTFNEEMESPAKRKHQRNTDYLCSLLRTEESSMSEPNAKERATPDHSDHSNNDNDELNVLNNETISDKRSRGRPRKVVREVRAPIPGKRGRGRPRKTDQLPSIEAVSNDSDNDGILAGFKEVDVNQVLRAKNLSIMADDSASQSASSTLRDRSRSSSVELIPDFDIFGSPERQSPVKPAGQSSSKTSGRIFR